MAWFKERWTRKGAISSVLIMLLAVGIVVLWIGVVSQAVTDVTNETLAKVYPGTAEYPSEADWQKFNASIGGRLLEGHPPGHVCYAPHFDSAKCHNASLSLKSSLAVIEDPTAIDYPWWGGLTCEPSAGKEQATGRCTLGNYPKYVVKAKTVQDVQEAMRFAGKHKLRVTIKNTGHDFLGRNIGYGSLSIWTRHLRGMNMTENWVPTKPQKTNTPHIRLMHQTQDMLMGKLSLARETHKPGLPAVTISAGETFGEAQSFLSSRGKVIAHSNEASVGAAGGWLLGGGHGPLSNFLGLGVDNVVEHEVVLPDGRVVIANQNSHPDLFWALRGGGGGTFGVVTKVTVKTFEPVTMNGFLLTMFPTPSEDSDYDFFDAVALLLTRMPKMTDFGITGTPAVSNTSFTGEFVAPNKTMEEINDFMKPIVDDIRNRGANVTTVPLLGQTIKPYNSVGVTNTIASRLISRKALTNILKVKHVLQTLKDIEISQPFPVAGGQVAKNLDLNVSVHPAWRDATLHWIIKKKRDASSTPTDMRGFYRSFTETAVKLLDPLSIESASYLNEANAFENNWQHVFWGYNYDNLLQVKKQYDPQNVLWCRHCVGSEVFTEGKDWRLYKTQP